MLFVNLASQFFIIFRFSSGSTRFGDLGESYRADAPTKITELFTESKGATRYAERAPGRYRLADEEIIDFTGMEAQQIFFSVCCISKDF